MSLKGLKRSGGKYDARQLVIATEDMNEAGDYFEYLNQHIEEFTAHLKYTFQIVTLNTLDGKSGPEQVLQRLKAYINSPSTKKQDLFFICIDKDRWKPQQLQAVHRDKDQRTTLMVSTPCFRTWLCLHDSDHADVTNAATTACKSLATLCGQLDYYSNKKKTFIGSSSFNKASIQKAIQQAKAITDDDARWPETTGSHVYRFFEQLDAL